MWNKHLGGTITLRDAETTVPGVRKLVEKTLYGSAFATRTAREITVALAVADLGPGAHALGDGARNLSTTSDTRRYLGLDRRPCKRCAHRNDMHRDQDGVRLCIVCENVGRWPCSRESLEVEFA